MKKPTAARSDPKTVTPMSKSDRLAAFAESLRGHDSYVLVGHVNPDPDCLGTMLAVGQGLRRLGKRVTWVSPDPVPEGLQFLPGADAIKIPPAPAADVLLVIDCEPARTGAVSEQLGDFKHVYNLDHHVTNEGKAPFAYVDAEAAATAEIAVELLVDHWGLTLEPDDAFNLYTALVTDTGSFRFRNTTARTLAVAARLVEAGVRPGAVAEAVYESMTWPAFQLLRTALASLERSDDGRVAWITLTRGMLASCGATEDDATGLSQYPRMIAGVDVSFVLRELEDGHTRVSLRSKGAVDVSVIAGRFGGGGHPGASGCTIQMPPSDALPKLRAVVDEVLATTTIKGGQAGR